MKYCFQALSKVPTNVQHFAELGVYKQIRKKLPTGDKDIFPHLPRQSFQLVGLSLIIHLVLRPKILISK